MFVMKATTKLAPTNLHLHGEAELPDPGPPSFKRGNAESANLKNSLSFD